VPDRVPDSAVTTDVILSVDDITVEYGTSGKPARAVDQVSFELARGEFLGIVGESGCGKSTLLFAIAQLLSPPALLVGGTVRFKGRDMVGLTYPAVARLLRGDAERNERAQPGEDGRRAI
jgi:peptide/nickel transport system ATP-binding protein